VAVGLVTKWFNRGTVSAPAAALGYETSSPRYLILAARPKKQR